MPTNCSCGANLPDDARFCHRCGKPQRDELPEPAPIPVSVLPAPVPQPTAITFGDPAVLRTSLLVASLATVAEIIPVMRLFIPVIGGMMSVLLYQRRSGQNLSPGTGAKLAWITAVFNTLLFTILACTVVGSTGMRVADIIQDQMRNGGTPAQQQMMQEMVKDPMALGAMVLFEWLFLFVLCSVLYMVGGALGARLNKPKPT